MSERTRIPSMGGHLIATELEFFARQSRGAIVELGSWLGACTLPLSSGACASDQEVHVFDNFRANASQVEKAARFNLPLSVGQDLLGIVEKNLGSLATRVTMHKGDIQTAKWPNRPIGLFVDDAAKTKSLFDHVLRTFGPAWMNGATLVFMDFFYHRKNGVKDHEEYRSQLDMMVKFPTSFRRIPLPTDPSSIAAFEFRDINGEFRKWARLR